MTSIDILGQNLFREALADKSLAPFDAAAQDMYDPGIPERCRADIYKALRFGLAGIAIHGWQQKIIEPLDAPYELAGKTVGHRFVPNYFPIDEQPVEAAADDPEFDQTSGWLSLQQVGVTCEQTMFDLLADPAGVVGGIALSEVQAKALEFIVAADELDLDKVPDMFNGGTPLHLAIYDKYGDYGLHSVHYALSGAAHSFIASTVNTTAAYMREAGRLVDSLGTNSTVLDLHASVYGLFRHAARASQRQDGFYTIVDHTDYPEFTCDYTDDGFELLWPTKNSRPMRRLKPGEEPTTTTRYDVLEANLRRQKCPAGYTAEATDIMPVIKLSDSLITYMIETGLDDPQLYTCKNW